ncbi:MAG: hypothetical protein JHC32_07790 [Candidatus Aminicenantes bacterium]|jgi:hypothetical protein|nr:hypothetical protein [Candidatus Aminicenantes bacterium]MCI4445912.1 hypothetical protein [Candidatus Aminicenantes bacterium]
MKKALALTLSVLFILSIFLLIPTSSKAATKADICWDDWERCRTRALESDLGVVRTTLALTVCDVALARCLMF